MNEYQFGPWLPDVTDFRNPGLEECFNVIPAPGGYQPAVGADTAIADVGATVLSAAMFERADGTRVTVCATAGDLHTVVGGTVVDSTLALTLTDFVAFARYGDAVYATEKNGGTWVLADIDVNTTFVAAANVIPSGRCMFRVDDFLMMGNLTDTDASDAPFRIRWSPYNNPGGDWETSVALQSDAVDMPSEFGPVIGGAGWSFGLILQRYGISRIDYRGGASVFAKEVVDKERGCVSSASVVTVGDRVYFLSDDGFFYSDGGPAQPISRGRVWVWFTQNVGQSFFEKVQGAVDWPNRCVVWSIPDEDGASSGLLYFNWETGWWSLVDVRPDCVFSSGRDGLTLEQVSAIYPDLDAMPVSLDSPAFKSRGRSVAAFIAGELVQLSGDTLAAHFATGEFQIEPGKRAFVSEVTPILTNAAETTTVQLTGRTRQTDTLVSTADVATGPIGFAPFNFDGRYFRVVVNVPAMTDWRDAYGFQMEAQVSGAT